MRIKTTSGSPQHLSDIASEVRQWKIDEGASPEFQAIFCNSKFLMDGDLSVFDGMKIHGSTSCKGAIDTNADFSNDVPTFAAMSIFDPEGSYGTSMVSLEEDAQKAAAKAVKEALIDADRLGEAPDVIWVSISPGFEEAALLGIQDVVGQGVPILGGSAADDDISGNWCVWDGQEKVANGLIITVMFPSADVSFAYQNGYAPDSDEGVVTKAEGRRIFEVDNRPTAEVFQNWTGSEIYAVPENEPSNIIAEAIFAPMGRPFKQIQGVPYYLLAHPSAVHPDGSVEFFAAFEEGEKLSPMKGTKEALIERASSVTRNACPDGSAEDVIGAMLVYCGACMMGVGEDMDKVANDVANTLDQKPYIGVFTFGEQGPILGHENRHGNLMISCLVFSQRK